MTTLTTPGLQQSIRSGWPIATLASIDLPTAAVKETWPDGIIRVWDGVGVLDYDGHEWKGIGPYGQLTGASGSKQLMLRSVTFRLVVPPSSQPTYLTPEMRNRPAKAWIAGMDAAGRYVNGDPFQEVDGLCDYQTLKSDENVVQSIELSVVEPIYSIERAQSLKYTSEWANRWLRSWRDRNLAGQRVTGFDRIPELQDATREWTRT